MISEEKDPRGYFHALLAHPPKHLPTPVLWDTERLKNEMPPSPTDANKGFFGKALLLAGSDLYPGAALLAAKACLAGGCGILTVYSHEAARVYFTALPEAIFRSGPAAKETVLTADAIGMGPGWGGAPDEETARTALLHAKKLLVDADGLNLLSREEKLKSLLSERAVITPHPGEMSRLTGFSIAEITANPAEIAFAFAEKYGCTVLLKGTCTVIASPRELAVTAEGNNGLSKGGSGDVLSGLITAMLCRGKEPFQAACLGSLLLGAGASTALKYLNTRLLRASDITDAITKGIL